MYKTLFGISKNQLEDEINYWNRRSNGGCKFCAYYPDLEMLVIYIIEVMK